MTDSGYMVEVIRQRKIEVTVYQSTGQGKQLILKADAGRVYIRFRGTARPVIPAPYPGNVPILAVAKVLTNEPEEYKFKDSPAMVTGEWYIISGTVGDEMEILTESYIGD